MIEPSKHNRKQMLRSRKQPRPSAASPSSSEDDSKPNQPTPFLSVFVPVVLLLSVLLPTIADRQLPTPKSVNAPLHEFSEERARIHLEHIVSAGVRTVGSVANEVITVEYIMGKVSPW